MAITVRIFYCNRSFPNWLISEIVLNFAVLSDLDGLELGDV